MSNTHTHNYLGSLTYDSFYKKVRNARVFLFVCFTEEENAFPQRALDSSTFDGCHKCLFDTTIYLIVPKWFFFLISLNFFLSALKNHCHAHPSLFFLCSLWWMPKMYTTYRRTICVLCNLDGTLPIFPFFFFRAMSVCVFFTSLSLFIFFYMYDIYFFPLFFDALKKTLPLFHYIFFFSMFFYLLNTWPLEWY